MTSDSLVFLVGGRAADNRSRIGTLSLASREISHCEAKLSPSPLLDVGPPGSYYCDGVSYPTLFNEKGVQKLLFTGWRRTRTKFENNLGIADFCESSQSWQPRKDPVFADDSLGTGSATIVHCEGDTFMVVTRFLGWKSLGRKLIPYYRPWIAEIDKVGFWRLTVEMEGLENHQNLAIARPMWIRGKENTLLWLSVRSQNKYHIIAGRLAGRQFQEISSLGLQPEGTRAWDSQSVEYAAPFRNGRSLAFLYNGDGFGRTGIGLAVCARDLAETL